MAEEQKAQAASESLSAAMKEIEPNPDKAARFGQPGERPRNFRAHPVELKTVDSNVKLNYTPPPNPKQEADPKRKEFDAYMKEAHDYDADWQKATEQKMEEEAKKAKEEAAKKSAERNAALLANVAAAVNVVKEAILPKDPPPQAISSQPLQAQNAHQLHRIQPAYSKGGNTFFFTDPKTGKPAVSMSNVNQALRGSRPDMSDPKVNPLVAEAPSFKAAAAKAGAAGAIFKPGMGPQAGSLFKQGALRPNPAVAAAKPPAVPVSKITAPTTPSEPAAFKAISTQPLDPANSHQLARQKSVPPPPSLAAKMQPNKRKLDDDVQAPISIPGPNGTTLQLPGAPAPPNPTEIDPDREYIRDPAGMNSLRNTAGIEPGGKHLDPSKRVRDNSEAYNKPLPKKWEPAEKERKWDLHEDQQRAMGSDRGFQDSIRKGTQRWKALSNKYPTLLSLGSAAHNPDNPEGITEAEVDAFERNMIQGGNYPTAEQMGLTPQLVNHVHKAWADAKEAVTRPRIAQNAQGRRVPPVSPMEYPQWGKVYETMMSDLKKATGAQPAVMQAYANLLTRILPDYDLPWRGPAVLRPRR